MGKGRSKRKKLKERNEKSRGIKKDNLNIEKSNLEVKDEWNKSAMEIVR